MSTTNSLHTIFHNSPLGVLEISASEKGIVSLYFEGRSPGVKSKPTEDPLPIIKNLFSDCVKQLEEYFNRKRKEFSLPLDLQGTDFQKGVWSELLNIPFGKTISYLQLSQILGDRNFIRAVGGANGKNPVSIIVPCHRVIGANGKLVGYGGGMEKKKWLLDFENADRSPSLFPFDLKLSSSV